MTALLRASRQTPGSISRTARQMPSEDTDGSMLWTPPCFSLSVRSPWQIYQERLEDELDSEGDPTRRRPITVGTYDKKSCYKTSRGTFVVDL